MRRLSFALVLVTGTLIAGPVGSEAAIPEYALKAQILVELLPYVQWHPDLEPRDRPFVILVLGRSPFGSNLDDYARPRTIQQRPIQIHYATKLSDATSCDVVFICRSESSRVQAILAWARGRRALTVSDDDRATRQGVMVCLLMENRFVRLAVNPDVAAAGGLFFSSQLLRYARILGTAHASP